VTTTFREIELPPVPASAGAARRFVADVLGESHPLIDTALLLVSELASNAILHAGSALVVCLRVTDRHLRIEVSDGDPRRPMLKQYDDDAVTGRGLHIVDAMADRWGVAEIEGGKAVWFELTFPDVEVTR
jgi:anti-sigma regulatory factor (Ser/Thr protein kinase)